MTRLGVLGGTFDPPHLGHLRAAEVVREALRLDQVLFVPAATPPHKVSPAVTDSEHRLAMLRAALVAEPRFAVSLLEIEREGPSYTVDTLAALAGEWPGAELLFVTGVDAFQEIPTWRHWETLIREYSFVVLERPGYLWEDARDIVPRDFEGRIVDRTSGSDAELPDGQPRIVHLRGATLNISSTELRGMVEKGRSIRFLVPREVEDYIREFRLYRGRP